MVGVSAHHRDVIVFFPGILTPAAKGPPMTDIDKALEIFQQDAENPKNQAQFYDLFLNTVFFIPTHPPEELSEEAAQSPEAGPVPLILESDGNDYLALFDTEERLTEWAQKKVGFVQVPGHVVARVSQPPLHWILNLGADYSKQFVPDEIAWLRQVVEQHNAAEEEGGN